MRLRSGMVFPGFRCDDYQYCRRSSSASLNAIQLGIKLASRYQFVMCPFFGNEAIFYTTILSALRMVLKRWAMVITVRPVIKRSSASITSFSDSVSSAAVVRRG